jgi:transmembrane sensor
MVNRMVVDRQYAGRLSRKLVAPAGQKASAVLPDGTSVWLNAGSTLKYPSHFHRRFREVTMTGEVYFDVKKDPRKQFRIHTGDLRVDVYGTSFNIKNHADDLFQEITVTEGTVGLHYQNREIRQMGAGQQAVLDKSRARLPFRTGQPALVAAWKENELIFDNTPIEEVVKYLERWYGVSISIDDEMKQKHSYTFKVKTETFREMMELMKRITPLTYEIDGRDVRIRYANKK